MYFLFTNTLLIYNIGNNVQQRNFTKQAYLMGPSNIKYCSLFI